MTFRGLLPGSLWSSLPYGLRTGFALLRSVPRVLSTARVAALPRSVLPPGLVVASAFTGGQPRSKCSTRVKLQPPCKEPDSYVRSAHMMTRLSRNRCMEAECSRENVRPAL